MANVIGLQLTVCQVPYLELWVIGEEPGLGIHQGQEGSAQIKGTAPCLKVFLDRIANFHSISNKERSKNLSWQRKDNED